MKESTFKIIAEDASTLNESFIKLDAVNKQFSFKLQHGENKAEGYCDLTDEEYNVFNAVFKRMVNNVERLD